MSGENPDPHIGFVISVATSMLYKAPLPLTLPLFLTRHGRSRIGSGDGHDRRTKLQFRVIGSGRGSERFHLAVCALVANNYGLRVSL